MPPDQYDPTGNIYVKQGTDIVAVNYCISSTALSAFCALCDISKTKKRVC